METELPALLRRREAARPERFTTHAARARLTSVTPEALAAMNGQGVRCATELADAGCDVLAYACLVAVMAAGPGAHERIERQLTEAAGAPVVSSAGALLRGVEALGAMRVALLTPYAPALTARVVEYLAAAGIEVVDAVSLDVTDNAAVGRLDPYALGELARGLDRSRAEALVVSACVQMPSLPVVQTVQDLTGLPTLSAATATTWAVLDRLGLRPGIDGAGRLLADPAPVPVA